MYRYIVIVHPLKSRTLCSLGNTKKIIVIVWCTAVLLSLPCLHVWNTETTLYYNTEKYVIDCACTIAVDEKSAVTWYQFMVMFFVPVIIMVFCYSSVIVVLWLSTKQLAKLTHSSNRSQEGMSLTRKSSPVHRGQSAQSADMMEARIQVIKMLLAIIVVFMLCWGPKLILHILKAYSCKCLHNDAAFIAMIVINLLPYLQSASNPIIYSFMSKNFRQSMRTAFKSCFCFKMMRSKNDNMRLESYKTMTYHSTALHATQVTNYSTDF